MLTDEKVKQHLGTLWREDCIYKAVEMHDSGRGGNPSCPPGHHPVGMGEMHDSDVDRTRSYRLIAMVPNELI